ncbi:hypothetical protein PRZ48_006556 [Zasmidium cellare]|uniref:Response regulatory domain-containing protein n=1 Tax=Zasmidium cellare TaxID=395010 RepID=A0ABR0EP30_ZASCE|nr:hypothetical protein PRZ48_006556 [Zasmidium cellare]
MARFSLRPIFRRLSSKHSVAAESSASDHSDTTAITSTSPSPILPGCTATPPAPRKSSSLVKLRDKFRAQDADIPEFPEDLRSESVPSLNTAGVVQQTPTTRRRVASDPVDKVDTVVQTEELGSSSDGSDSPRSKSTQHNHPEQPPELKLDVDELPVNPRLVVEEPTPDALARESRALDSFDFAQRPASGEVTLASTSSENIHQHPAIVLAASPSHSANSLHSPYTPDARRQSIVGSANAKIVRTLIDAPQRADTAPASASTGNLPTGDGLNDYFTSSIPNMAGMLQRKIWVKRPNQSATLVQIREDDLVDDVREMILRKYANSLGKTFDAPDMTLSIAARAEHAGPRSIRMLGPEEEICRTIDSYYPGGQTVDEALIIDVPQKRTPRPSPRNVQYQTYHPMEDLRPHENGTDYFPPMPAMIQPTLPHNVLPPNVRDHHHPIAAADHPRSISVLNTGQIPPLPSPGGRNRGHRAEREHRPKYTRQHTSSPTIITHSSTTAPPTSAANPQPPAHLPHRASNRPRVDSTASEHHHPNGLTSAPPLPTPPAPDSVPMGRTNSNPPTPSTGAPNSAHTHRSSRPKKTRKPTPDRPGSKRGAHVTTDTWAPNPSLPNVSSMLDGSVPPINVLIVEDNIINLRILEGLMKRLKVRWQTAMNGQIAVDKWKQGGYHLVLMDIQMPIMNGLQATKEIRRLERVNGIGVFSSSAPTSPTEKGDDGKGKEKAHNPEDDRLAKGEGLFKSPIIIVALTASSLQSDRHEALAAGCNDFLTKPVNFVWLERKVKEWGCMQALIDFDGWRKWKDYAAKEEESKSEEQKQKEREKEEKERIKMEKMAKLQEKQKAKKEEDQRKKRESMEAAGAVKAIPEEPATVAAS